MAFSKTKAFTPAKAMKGPGAGSRLQVGADVPWVTSWSEEPLGGVRPCPSVDGHLAIQQAANAGVGRPIYSQNHLVRQRLSVRHMRCPMCGLPTEEKDRWSQTGRLRTIAEVREKGLSHLFPRSLADDRLVFDGGAIAPLHERCVRLSNERCPHLQKHAAPEGVRFPARWVVTPLLIEAQPQPGSRALQVPAASVPVISFLQVWGLPDEGKR